jgi:hypothetical protein
MYNSYHLKIRILKTFGIKFSARSFYPYRTRFIPSINLRRIQTVERQIKTARHIHNSRFNEVSRIGKGNIVKLAPFDCDSGLSSSERPKLA